MAQVTASDDLYASLIAVSQERGSTPDQLVSALIELLVREDQLAFWGEGIVENLERQMAEAERPGRHLSPEEFFAELDAVSSQETDPADADV
jgi:hypothetical protein